MEDPRPDTKAVHLEKLARVYVKPNGRPVAMTSEQRPVHRRWPDFLVIRGQEICASPWCDAPSPPRRPHPASLRTWTDHGDQRAGILRGCNHAEQADGWQQHVISPPDERQQVETITPTGHHYRATPPPPRACRRSA